MSVLTRKEKADLTRTETYVRDRIERTVRGISEADVTFLDEIYYLIDSRVEAMDNLSEVRLPIIDENTPVESKLYNTIAEDIRELSEVNLETIKDVYESLNDIYNDVFSSGEDISSSLSLCNSLLGKIENNLKSKKNLSSIKNEVAVLAIGETIGAANRLVTPALPSVLSTEDTVVSMDLGVSVAPGYEGSEESKEIGQVETGNEGLNVDECGGFITLMPSERTRLDSTVSVEFTKPMGRIITPGELVDPDIRLFCCNGNPLLGDSMNFFTDGYFNTRVISDDPVFPRNQKLSSLDYLTDNSLDTEYLVEYNTKVRDSLGMTITLDVSDINSMPRRVDQIVIELSQGDSTSVLSSENTLPRLSRLLLDQTDITSRVLDNTVIVGQSLVGSSSSGFKSTPTTPNPVGSFITEGKQTKSVSVSLIAENPQVIYIPETRIVNAAGQSVGVLNYFETLIINGYTPPIDCPDPADMYRKGELDILWSISDTHSLVSREPKTEIFRYFIAIKDIAAYSISYETSGYIISNNLNTDLSKKVASVELYTNEVIPEGTSINFYVSHNKENWIQISPVSRALSNGLPTRIVYNGIEEKAGDKHAGLNSPNVYLKIEMSSDGTTSPILKAYAAVIKLI